MTDVLAVLQKLPAECLSTLPSDRRQLIGIKRGQPGYIPLNRYETAKDAECAACAFNDARGVDRYQRMAMEGGSMFGWHVPGADPDYLREMEAKKAKRAH